MRTFVILLLLANLLYFGWNRGWLRDTPEPAAPELAAAAADALPPFVPSDRRLTLLAEAPDSQITLGQPLASDTDLAMGQPPDSLASDTDATVGQPLDSEVASMGLASMGQPLDSEESGEPQSPGLPGPRWCAELGLFTTAEPAEALLPELVLLGIDAELASGRRPVGTTFWVHTRLFDSQAEALTLLRELQAKDIDSYYIREGELAGRISLGVFSRNASAEQVQSVLGAQGYAAEVSRVARQVDRFWLDLEASSAAVLETPDWRALVAGLASSAGEAGAAAADAPQLTEKVCNDVATPNQFP